MDPDKKYKILIIDDDAFILNMYVAKFQKSGHDVDTARSGVEAISKIKDGYKPDVILIDIVLPDINGLDFLHTIKTENLAPDSICVMFTNQNSSAETDRAKELGVAGYIIKANLIPSEVVTKVLEVAQNQKK